MARRYAVAGTGSRAQSYIRAMFQAHPEEAQLVALLDPNPGGSRSTSGSSQSSAARSSRSTAPTTWSGWSRSSPWTGSW